MSGLPNLTDAEWKDLLKRLTVFAHHRIRRLQWYGVSASKNGDVPFGEFEDGGSLAVAAVAAVLSGERACHATDAQTLLKELMSVVNSKVSHAVELAQNRARRLPGDPLRAIDRLGSARSPRPDSLVEEGERLERLRARIKNDHANDKVALQVLECVEAGVTKPSDIAELTEVKTSEVNNAKKRLQRTVQAIQDDTRKAEHGRSRPTR